MYMIVDVWKPNFGKIDNKKCVMSYGLADTDQFLTEKKTGWKVRYTCDVCCDGKIHTTRGGSLFGVTTKLNTIEKQTCRSCRSRFSEHEIKKTYIPFSKIKKSIEGSNYILINSEEEYMGSNNRSQYKHEIKCENNHNLYATWNNWSKGKRCRLCYETNKFNNAVKYKNGWERYKFLVWYYTEKSYKKHYKDINPNNLKRGKEYHLDHKYSIYEGFLNNVSPKIVGGYNNLDVITRNENLKKHKSCSISLNELVMYEKVN
jgi:hypothetical protein